MAESIPVSSSSHLLNIIGRILLESGVRWGAIGALAVAYHGWVRASMDADALITLRDSEVDIGKLLERLRSQGWNIEFREGEEGDPLGFVIRIHDSGGNQVDLIGGIRRLDPRFFERVIETEMNGLNLLISSPEDLIALKIYAGGPKDLEDAAGVLEVLGSTVDRTLLISLCHRFGHEEEKRCKRLLRI